MEKCRRLYTRVCVYCEEPDQKYARAFLDLYKERVLSAQFNGQMLAVELSYDGFPRADEGAIRDIFAEHLSKAIRSHRMPSYPPTALVFLRGK